MAVKDVGSLVRESFTWKYEQRLFVFLNALKRGVVSHSVNSTAMSTCVEKKCNMQNLTKLIGEQYEDQQKSSYVLICSHL